MAPRRSRRGFRRVGGSSSSSSSSRSDLHALSENHVQQESPLLEIFAQHDPNAPLSVGMMTEVFRAFTQQDAPNVQPAPLPPPPTVARSGNNAFVRSPGQQRSGRPRASARDRLSSLAGSDPAVGNPRSPRHAPMASNHRSNRNAPAASEDLRTHPNSRRAAAEHVGTSRGPAIPATLATNTDLQQQIWDLQEQIARGRSSQAENDVATSENAFTKQIMSSKLGRDIKMPTLSKYDGTGCPTNTSGCSTARLYSSTSPTLCLPSVCNDPLQGSLHVVLPTALSLDQQLRATQAVVHGRLPGPDSPTENCGVSSPSQPGGPGKFEGT